jgi:LAGLIDADG DNA endonuclease family protein
VITQRDVSPMVMAQAWVDVCDVVLHPDIARRRLVPDAPQVQIILGSLLGGARLEGPVGERAMRVAHPRALEAYTWWKYERLASLATEPPALASQLVAFRTIAHPLFDDLAPLFAGGAAQRARVVRELLGPLGLAVWMTDVGRLELRPELFIPTRRAPLALIA